MRALSYAIFVVLDLVPVILNSATVVGDSRPTITFIVTNP